MKELKRFVAYFVKRHTFARVLVCSQLDSYSLERMDYSQMKTVPVTFLVLIQLVLYSFQTSGKL